MLDVSHGPRPSTVPPPQLTAPYPAVKRRATLPTDMSGFLTLSFRVSSHLQYSSCWCRVALQQSVINWDSLGQGHISSTVTDPCSRLAGDLYCPA